MCEKYALDEYSKESLEKSGLCVPITVNLTIIKLLFSNIEMTVLFQCANIYVKMYIIFFICEFEHMQ